MCFSYMHSPFKTSLILGVGLIGCAANGSPTSEAENASTQTGDVGEALAVGAGCDRGELLAAATGDRRAVLQRGFDWYDQHVPYSQSKYHEGYRTDCSGYVSMCWGLGTSYTTANFSEGSGEDVRLGSFSEMLPGDAAVYRASSHGHVVLFAGWAGGDHSRVCLLQEASTKEGLTFGATTLSYLENNGYKPIRAKNLPAGGDDTGADDPGATGPSDPGPYPPGSNDQNGPMCSPGGGPCASDTDCCSVNDGATCDPDPYQQGVYYCSPPHLDYGP